MNRIDWKDVGKRAGKTFLQAFLAAVSIDKFAAITDVQSAKVIIRSILIGAVSAGISATWNMLRNYVSQKSE